MPALLTRGVPRRLLIVGALLIVGLLPLWIGRYPPLNDYPQHLLGAQIVVHYNDPNMGYAAGYEIRPGWYLRSNALGTLLMIGLGQVLPVPLAGQLTLSLYVLLFVGGLWLWLRQTGAPAALIMLALPLTYNVTFTSGFLNFVYGTALALYAFVVVLRWQDQPRPYHLLILALLLVLIYTAHLMVWLLTVVVIVVIATTRPRPAPYEGLFLALNSAIPLLLFTRPVLAVPAALVAPCVWMGLALLRWLRLRSGTLAFATGGAMLLATLAIRQLKPVYTAYAPGVTYDTLEKLATPLRLFSLRQQFLPPDTWLTGYNLVLLGLLAVVGGLLGWSSWRCTATERAPWLAGLGVLAILYVLIPTRTVDLWIIEPRVLLFAAFLALACVRLPRAGSRLHRAITLGLVAIAVWSGGGTLLYAWSHAQHMEERRAEIAQLSPARTLLVLFPEERSVYPLPLRLLSRLNNSEHVIVTYTVEHGGFNSWAFDNGPVQPRPDLPIPLYFWASFSYTDFVAERCTELHSTYDAVVVWGQADAALTGALDACFGQGTNLSSMAIWRVSRGR